jgi:ribosomal protein L7Ae-like RNA K-turn-binding protein
MPAPPAEGPRLPRDADVERRALSLVGLGVKARRVAVGVDAAREALQRGAAEAIVLAADASERARERLVALAGHKHVPVFELADAERLGASSGHPPVHGVAVLDRQLARGLRQYLAAAGREEKRR